MYLTECFISDEQVALVNFELDIPPQMEYLPHRIPVQVVEKDVMAEAQFLAQQRKYWPSGFLWNESPCNKTRMKMFSVFYCDPE